ncbi:hypothetical protein K7432_011718 [Basidiobolus ranarum]|uniref:FCP1 homology domain-containing protein n=1 Tax=Basidiobolus ranarum TaxID=34480 RepID=A0ABR2WLV4_9FUNG
MTNVLADVVESNNNHHNPIAQVQQENDGASEQALFDARDKDPTFNRNKATPFSKNKSESKNTRSFLSTLLSCACGGKAYVSEIQEEEKYAMALSNTGAHPKVAKPSPVPEIAERDEIAPSIPEVERVIDRPALVDDKYLLGPIAKEHTGRKCLVLDLDETLVHSSFKAVEQADFVIPVEIEGQYHSVYVLKRPGVDEFLKEVGKIFEIVIFTASLAKYADPVLDTLDIHNVIHYRLFRESCYNYGGNYVKDLSQLGRDLRQVIILDNSPASYIFHPTNAVPVSSWFNDPHDTELLDLVPLLEDLQDVEDVTVLLDTVINMSQA